MKILILSHQGIGDIIVSLPIYYAVRKKYPNAIIISTVKTKTESTLLKSQNFADEFIYLNTSNMTKIEKIIWFAKIALKRYDYIVVPLGININMSILLKFLSVSKNIICSYNNIFQQKLISFPISFHRYAKRVYNNQLIASFFIDNNKKELPHLNIIPTNIFERFNLDINKEYISIHPGTGIIEKHRRWDSLKYAELINKILYGNYNYIFLILGVPDEINICNDIILNIEDKGSVISLSGKTSINETIEILSKSICLISADSGIMHIASAINLKTFSIFGPTAISLAAPYWNNGKSISNLPPCAPCYPDKLLGCKDPICMQNVTVDMVYNSMKEDGII
jgi:ADP-heptose:LPS heptosyltransferase